MLQCTAMHMFGCRLLTAAVVLPCRVALQVVTKYASLPY